MTRFATYLGGVAVAAMLAASAPAMAQTAEPDATDALLLKLKEKGILSDEEYQALSARKSAQPAPAAISTGDTSRGPQQAAAERLDDKRLVKMMDSGVGIQIGDVGLKFSGSVNGFYVHDKGDKALPQNVVAGGLATVGNQSSSVRNGLLPGFLKVDVTSKQAGWDVGAHFGLYPGIDSNSGGSGANGPGAPAALQTAGIDFRQVYLTFGKPNVGEFKIGRDIGLFGSDAILNDITLLAVGTAAGNSAPSNTSLGRIGLGYIYTDFQPQISYSSPKMAGFQVSAGIFQPLTTIGRSEVNSTPGFQAKLTYDHATEGGLGIHAWVSGLSQKHDASGGLPSYTGNAVDVGAKLSYAGASLLGYYYTGKGVGTTGLFILSTDARGVKRKSEGFYVQGTYTIDKFTVGGSYGESRLDLASGEASSILVRSNANYVGQLRYALTSWVTLIGEYTHTKSKAHNGNDASSDALAAGGILFF